MYLEVKISPEGCPNGNPIAKDNPAFICAEAPVGKGPCYDDSGSPLVVDNKLIGVASCLAKTSCTDGLPAAYSNIEFYYQWLIEIITE